MRFETFETILRAFELFIYRISSIGCRPSSSRLQKPKLQLFKRRPLIVAKWSLVAMPSYSPHIRSARSIDRVKLHGDDKVEVIDAALKTGANQTNQNND